MGGAAGAGCWQARFDRMRSVFHVHNGCNSLQWPFDNFSDRLPPIDLEIYNSSLLAASFPEILGKLSGCSLGNVSKQESIN